MIKGQTFVEHAETDEKLRCSFCQKRQDEVRKLISSPSTVPRAYICDECIEVCSVILEEGKPEMPGNREPAGI